MTHLRAQERSTRCESEKRGDTIKIMKSGLRAFINRAEPLNPVTAAALAKFSGAIVKADNKMPTAQEEKESDRSEISETRVQS